LPIAAVALFANPVHAAVPDLTERPALISARAAKSVLLAVTAAGLRLVTVGERGIVLLSDDSGVTWRQAKVPVSVTLTAVRFATPRIGWALGNFGVVLYTEDGGETWAKQLDGMQAAKIVLDSTKTQTQGSKDNAGALQKQLASSQQLVADGPDKPFLDLYFENERSGFIAGAYNLIFRTEDGGKTWQPWQNHVDNPKGLHLYGIRSAGSEIYLVGERGLFLRSKDKGKTFNALRTPYEGTYFGLITTKDGGLLAYGLRGQAFWSGNHGNSWRKIETGISISLTASAELQDGTLVLVSQGGDVLVSRDKGHSFKRIIIPAPSPFTGVAQAADGSLVLAGVRGMTKIPNPSLSTGSSPRTEGARR
jgi:photosystem II stability/assembly factor-like uncharacterized protein